MSLIANLKPAVTRTLGRSSLLLQKHSPEILIGAGITGILVAGVMAGRATLKLSPVLESKRENIAIVRGLQENPGEEPYDDKIVRQDIAKIYIRTSLDIIKIYAPSFLLAAGGTAAILSAHGIMRRRNVALVAAAKLIESKFEEYRERVAEEIGEEKESKIFGGKETKKIVKDPETGEEREEITRESSGYSIYSKFFDQTSSQWENNAEYNRSFLAAQEAEFTRILQSRGHVFLNDVYDALDIPRTTEGQLVGWVYDPTGEKGDNFVDFGIFRLNEQGETPTDKRRFLNGLDNVVRLDFNVDGFVLDLI